MNALNKLEPDARGRMLQSVATLYGISLAAGSRSASEGSHSALQAGGDLRPSFTEDRVSSPKEFIWQKQPKKAVERVACLAFYLTHYRGTKYFKTADITALNMDAAQLKFSNPAMMVAEAIRAGYLAAAGGQNKQLTAVGEEFVRLLPDREAAHSAIK